MRIPPDVVPLLQQVLLSLPHRRGLPLEFWNHDHQASVLDAFMAFASALMRSDLREEDLPQGYVMLAYLFHWEADCQADGWGAFGNIDSRNFKQVCGFFAEVGLHDEAVSLRHQMAVYEAHPDDHTALNAASEAHRHPLSGDLDRLDYLSQYFCEHAERLLYLQD